MRSNNDLRTGDMTTSPGNHSNDTQPMTTSAIILLFVGLMIAMFMFSLNQTVLATALPTIVGELDGVDQMLWVSTAFMLASTIMMPIYGKVGDLFGRKPLFMFAICCFLAGSVFALVANEMSTLILGRVLQGIGGGGMMILSQSIIASVVPARERGKYMGIMGSAFAVSSVAGPLIGGWLTEGPGWRWAFAINFPLGAVALIAAAVFLKIPKHTHGPRPKIDVGGMALISIVTSCIVLVSAWGGHDYEWGSWQINGLIIVGALAIVAFVIVESKVSEPVIPLRLFVNRDFLLSTIAGLFIGVSMFGVLSYMPTYLQMVHGIDATVAGLMMVPMMGTMLLSSTLIGFVVARTGRYKRYPLIGILLIGASLVLLSTLKADSPAWEPMVGLALLGLGLGLSMQILVLVVQNAFPVEMVGTATAANNYFRQVGATLGMAFIGSVFTQRLLENIKAGMTDLAAASPDAQPPQVSSTGLTPQIVSQMPEPLHTLIITSYNDALVPLFLWVAPLAFAGFVILLFLPNTPLAKTLKKDTTSREHVLVPEGAEVAAATPASDSLSLPTITKASADDDTDDSHDTPGRGSRPPA
ncbi:MDR family MFS transporter [Brevibacterium casei]|uniref:EmrB/QacA subfamily drug resistance transporter n=3 Tax=Brevibacteriaceae TaxID=85019 RepID=K9AKL9_9MICO|nr:MDR family MFS transporter [Brevibacterium casei]EKU47863.1 EmrB/QacA subfamily drug resistance transporter [Brevibacterium casei S18]MCT2184250.1 MFS transporter [Brevibacterium casei]MCT2359585.1 MFS transporter [Brevibacterium casei]